MRRRRNRHAKGNRKGESGLAYPAAIVEVSHLPEFILGWNQAWMLFGVVITVTAAAADSGMLFVVKRVRGCMRCLEVTHAIQADRSPIRNYIELRGSLGKSRRSV